tara:strand:+ start:375 stop:776 length:402 start_codon:yes stop_codon:yes gene_type:complete
MIYSYSGIHCANCFDSGHQLEAVCTKHGVWKHLSDSDKANQLAVRAVGTCANRAAEPTRGIHEEKSIVVLVDVPTAHPGKHTKCKITVMENGDVRLLKSLVPHPLDHNLDLIKALAEKIHELENRVRVLQESL